MNINITDLSKSYQQLEEKAMTIYKLSGYTLDDIIKMLAKGFELVPPKPTTMTLEKLYEMGGEKK